MTLGPGSRTTAAPLSLVVRPVGDSCNLRCPYCYLGSKVCQPVEVMSTPLVDTLIRQAGALSSQVHFLWHGGEPLLAGLDFYTAAMAAQAESASAFTNYLQTNGTLVDVRWAAFFRRHSFNVRLSLDGDRVIHDRQRFNHAGRGSHTRVEAAFRLLADHGLRPQVSCVLTESSTPHADEIYDYLVTLGACEIAFLPCFQRAGAGVHPMTLSPSAYVDAYSRLYERWSGDRRTVHVRELEGVVAGLLGQPGGDCTWTGGCSRVVRVDNDGTAAPCELHESLPPYGKLTTDSLEEILRRQQSGAVSCLARKRQADCHQCRWFMLCRGGCYAQYVTGEGGEERYYYCEARQRLFERLAERLCRTADFEPRGAATLA